MSWKPRLLSLEESIAWIVISGFFVVIPACLYGHGLHPHDWKQCVDLVFWVGMFAYGIWSGIQSGRRNRWERIEREKGLDTGNNR
jgi:hypothetical protein